MSQEPREMLKHDCKHQHITKEETKGGMVVLTKNIERPAMQLIAMRSFLF